MANIPIIYKYLRQKKVGGCLDLIFSFSGVNDTTETNFDGFQSNYLGEFYAICKMTYMGLKKTESQKSCATVPLLNM
jgi:hypothetical protein